VESVEVLVYQPTDEEMQTKSAFWAKAQGNPMVDPDNIPVSTVKLILNDTRVERWWKKPGFKDWFLNKEEWKQKLEYAINVGLDAMLDLLRDPQAQGSAKVRAFEILARLANREPAKVKEVKMLDAAVAEMDQKQLDEFIKKNLKLLNPDKKVG
jgi:hypothetical protein